MNEKEFLENYIEFVSGMASSYTADDEVFQSKIDDLKEKFSGNFARMETAVAGIAGEAGEINDLWKKIKFHGLDWDETQKTKMVSEIGDMYWYLMQASISLGVSPIEMMQKNLEKLQIRHKGNSFNQKIAIEKEMKKVS